MYLQGCSVDGPRYCPASLSSRLISSGARWKCLQFWFYGWYDYLEVSLVSKLRKTTFKRKFYARPSWSQMRVNISEDFPYQVNAII